jgi:hypothetical protein
MAGPIVDRFVRTNVTRAIDTLSGRGPADTGGGDGDTDDVLGGGAR